MLNGIATLATRYPRRVLAATVAAAVVAGGVGGNVAQNLLPYDSEDPATGSAKADQSLRDVTGLDPETGLIAIVQTPEGPRAAGSRARVARTVKVLRADRDVGQVTTFYGRGGRDLVARDGRSQIVAVRFRDVGDDDQQDAAERLSDELNGNEVKLGGFAAASADVNKQVEDDLRRAEMLAFPILFLLSFLFFRSLVAAALPLVVGALAIVGTFFALKLLNEVTDISVFALNLITGLGLGLAIDYSLFMVARYREEIAKDGAGPDALRRTMATAGRTVLFSSMTVAAALASLLIFPQNFLYSMGLGGSLVAIMAALVSLLVLPAVLHLLGERVNALSPKWLRSRAEAEARPEHAGFWYRLSQFVMRRPGRIAIVSATLLIVVGLPFLDIKFIAVDASVLPKDTASRQVDIALERDFAPGRGNAIYVAVESPPSRALRDYSARLGRLPGADAATPPQPVGKGRSQISVFPAQEELTDKSQDLVREIRAAEAPAKAYAGGQTAEFVDLKRSLVSHLPVAILLVAAATLIVLFLMTGSVVLPIKALVMNVLTLSATFGILVLIFQDGRLEGLLGYTSQGAIEATNPVLLFAVVFGLSTDYGVFLLSRIKEAVDAGLPNSEAVAVGLERTGRIVTAAAVLFSIAVGAFATSEIIFIKENGVGIALAVLIDATIIRALLVPSLMELLGEWNWWAPKPLRRLHERFALQEGTSPPPPQPQEA